MLADASSSGSDDGKDSDSDDSSSGSDDEKAQVSQKEAEAQTSRNEAKGAVFNSDVTIIGSEDGITYDGDDGIDDGIADSQEKDERESQYALIIERSLTADGAIEDSANSRISAARQQLQLGWEQHQTVMSQVLLSNAELDEPIEINVRWLVVVYEQYHPPHATRAHALKLLSTQSGDSLVTSLCQKYEIQQQEELEMPYELDNWQRLLCFYTHLVMVGALTRKVDVDQVMIDHEGDLNRLQRRLHQKYGFAPLLVESPHHDQTHSPEVEVSSPTIEITPTWTDVKDTKIGSGGSTLEGGNQGARAYSAQLFRGPLSNQGLDQGVQWIAAAPDKFYYIGLTSADQKSSSQHHSIKYSLNPNQHGHVSVWAGRTRVLDGAKHGALTTYKKGDRFRVWIENATHGHQVSFYKNDERIYTSPDTPTFPLYVCASMAQNGSQATQVQMFGSDSV
jgi:hypothetical protein